MLLVGDTFAKKKDEDYNQGDSHAHTLLFGDAGSATLIEKAEGSDLVISSVTDVTGFRMIAHPYDGWRNPKFPEDESKAAIMSDIDVFNFATTEGTTQINEYMQVMGTKPEDYDCLVLHQENKMIMKRIAKKTGFPEEKNLSSIETFANTSGASIPVTLSNCFGDDDSNDEIRPLCCGFGVGLSWVTASLTIPKSGIYPVIHTDEYFKDGFESM